MDRDVTGILIIYYWKDSRSIFHALGTGISSAMLILHGCSVLGVLVFKNKLFMTKTMTFPVPLNQF